MSDVIVVMNNGRIEQMGDPRTLYSKPESVFVANFIGEANLLKATVIGKDGDRTALRWNGQEVQASALAHAAQAGDSACIVVKPEAIRFSSQPAKDVNAMPGKIRQRVFKGNHTSMLVEVADGTRLNALLHLGDAEAVKGEDVWISWKPQNATVIRDEAVPA